MNKKVLYIEDNEQNIYLISFILEKNGIEVYKERDGKSGIEAAARIKPDLILLDILLPEMDGYQVAEIIHKNPELSKTPIVAVTSYAMVGDREKAFRAGCNGYIEKPINPDTFFREINYYLTDNPNGIGEK